jgi:hypothetical protein
MDSNFIDMSKRVTFRENSSQQNNRKIVFTQICIRNLVIMKQLSNNI